MKLRKFTTYFALLSILLTTSVFAQTTTGILTGTVTTEGAPLPGATVTITSPSLQGTRTTVTSETGSYVFPALPPGDYRVTFELSGMATVTRQVRVALASTARADANLAVSSVSEAITVTAAAANVLETGTVAANFQQEFIEQLPTGRSVTDAAALAPGVSPEGPNNQVMISGAPSFENLYLVNGAVVNDNLRGQPEAVFIEDALEETTVLTSAVSAEYGRFTGGVVNAITKSGGNEFSGSIRDSLTQDNWTEDTPFPGQAERADDLNEVWEGTLGGRILRDRLWFFGAGRLRETTSSAQTTITRIPFTRADEERRFEGKLTGQIGQGHTLVASYLDRLTEQTNNSFGTIIDTRSLTNRELPNTLTSFHYNGVLTSNLLLQGLYSQREFAFVGGGAQSRDLIEGTLVRDPSFRRGWSPTFCGVCGDKERDNEMWNIKGSYFLSTASLGTHNIVAGYEDFTELRKEDNQQSGSDFRLVGEWVFQGEDAFIRVNPANSRHVIQWWPVLNLSQTAETSAQGIFINDTWDLNNNFSFNLGVRYDRNEAIDQAGAKRADDSAFSPRLQVIYDLFGNGGHRIYTSYGRYLSKIDQGISDSASNAGSPAFYQWDYAGPALNIGSGPYLTTDQVLTQVFDWFRSVGFTDNTQHLRAVSLPGVNVVIPDEGLDSPYMDEWSIGYGTQLGARGSFRADYINRSWGDFYVETTTLDNGTVFDNAGNEFDLTVVRNGEEGLERTYSAIQLQGGYRIGQRINIGGNYTWSELEGNVTAETSNNATITTGLNSYPEYTSFAQNNPKGALLGDVRHRANAWVQYDLPTPVGNFNFSLLQRFHSGFPYSAVGAIPADYIENPGYIDPPTTITYFFSDRGAFRTDDITRTDLGVNYRLGIGPTTFFIEADLLNMFNEDGIDDPTFLEGDVFTAADDDDLQPFNPLTETPVEGVHYRLADNFGEPTSANAYQLPRTYRFSVGLKF